MFQIPRFASPITHSRWTSWSAFVLVFRPMQRHCYRSNWFQEILSAAISLFSTSFVPLRLPTVLFRSSPLERESRLQRDRKTAGSLERMKRAAEMEEGERYRMEEKKERKTRRGTNIQPDIPRDLHIFFRYFLSLFIPSASYHAATVAAALLRLARNPDHRIVSTTARRLHR